MGIPDFQTLMRPGLACLEDGQVSTTRSIRETLADSYALSEADRTHMLPSGRARTFDNRVSWALTYLSQAGLIERPRRGHVQITAAGHQALADHPQRIDMATLEQYPSYVEFRRRRGRHNPASQGALDVAPLEEIAATPADLITQAVADNRAAVEGDVLRAALALSATGFEDLVIRLLETMGYGRAGSVERTSSSGDAGVDGIISQDPLGLDRIYVQAKRYAEDRAIDRPRIHEFAGALLGKQGDRGVYITTSRFTDGARREAERINARIELIDGARLAELLVAHGVGVEVESQATLYRLDEDFFETL